MDFNSLKDMNNLKALLKNIGNDFVKNVSNVKNISKDDFKNGFNTYFVDYLKNNYLEFEGRVSRHQYWMFAIYSILIAVALQIVIFVLPFLAFLSHIYFFALLVPSVGLGIRRLHDINLFGLFFLIAIIPVLGFFAMLFLFSIPSDAGDNKYGSVVK